MQITDCTAAPPKTIRGSVTFAGDEIISCPAFPVAVPDTTGAGDVFLAAYTVARFRNRDTVARSGRYAAKLAASHVAGRYLPDVLAVPRRPAANR